MVERIAFDQETFLIGPGAPFPKPVCATFAQHGLGGEIETRLCANGDPGGLGVVYDQLLAWLESDPTPFGQTPTREVVCHNGHGFDWPVMAIHFPVLLPRIFRAMERGQIRDTIIREKLLNLARTGQVDWYFTPDGEAKEVHYRLADLAALYLRVDRRTVKGVDEKGDQIKDDVWRLHYDSLDGQPAKNYPEDARAYAIEDAEDTLLIADGQDSRARDFVAQAPLVQLDGTPYTDVFRVESLHVGAMFALSLATYEGFGIDPVVVADMKAQVEKARRPEQIELLFQSGLLSRPQPPRPYKNGAKNADGTPKLVPEEPIHLSRKALTARVVQVHERNKLCQEPSCPDKGTPQCSQHGLGELKRNPPTEGMKKKKKAQEANEGVEGSVCCDGEVIDTLSAFDPVLDCYGHYMALEKIVTTEIPKLEDALVRGQGVIHGGFEDMKKTSRTSSRRTKNYPSVNIQQIPRSLSVEEVGPDLKPVLVEVKPGVFKPKTIKVEPRHAYIPRRGSGWVLVSIDYSFIELVTLAHQLKRTIGYSRLLEKINLGFDPHAFLGSQLAVGADPGFAAKCAEVGALTDDAIYVLFRSLRGKGSEEKAFYKRWRSFAKPTGLGFPGGLGAATFIAYAKATYGVTIASVEQAKQFRDVWLKAFPECDEYLNRYLRDHFVTHREVDKEGKKRERYGYFSPLGTYRSKCSYTECANGYALQTPSAEGAKIGVFNVQRACWDSSVGSCLYGCRVVAAIHDEILVEIPDDRWLHERAFEASKLWIQSMKLITPEANVQAEPAAMRRWDKNAEPVYGPDERLRVWEPGVDYKMDSKDKMRSEK